MSRRTKTSVDPNALAVVNSGLEKYNENSAGDFNGFRGSLPKGTSVLLSDIVEILLRYLRDERGFSNRQISELLEESLPKVRRGRRVVKKVGKLELPSVEGSSFHVASRDGEDDAVRIAVGVLNSIASVMRLRDAQITVRDSAGKAKQDAPLSRDAAITYLLSGDAGLNHHIYVRRQREHSRKGSQLRSEGREARERRVREIGTPLRQRNPHISNTALAKKIVEKGGGNSEHTIRQMLTKLGLAKRG